MNTRENSYTQTRAIRANITGSIAAGDWQPGDRLPTERVLAAEYGIARNTVRALLHELEREGAIVRHVGKGSFVADKGGTGKSLSAPSIADASPSDFDVMRKCLERGEAARSWREFEQWDAAFHEALAKATKNHAVIDILKSINIIRDAPAWGALKKKSLTDARRKIFECQHRAIFSALEKRES
jgi:DNA-binding FadR family transcriptional regulator